MLFDYRRNSVPMGKETVNLISDLRSHVGTEKIFLSIYVHSATIVIYNTGWGQRRDTERKRSIFYRIRGKVLILLPWREMHLWFIFMTKCRINTNRKRHLSQHQKKISLKRKYLLRVIPKVLAMEYNCDWSTEEIISWMKLRKRKHSGWVRLSPLKPLALYDWSLLRLGLSYISIQDDLLDSFHQ